MTLKIGVKYQNKGYKSLAWATPLDPLARYLKKPIQNS
jgi:hypothetical protein